MGLDPQIRRQIWEMIQRLHRDGITIMLTTHYIEEAEKLCGRVGILNRGRLIALGSRRELVQGVGGYVVESTRTAGAIIPWCGKNRQRMPWPGQSRGGYYPADQSGGCLYQTHR